METAGHGGTTQVAKRRWDHAGMLSEERERLSEELKTIIEAASIISEDLSLDCPLPGCYGLESVGYMDLKLK